MTSYVHDNEKNLVRFIHFYSKKMSPFQKSSTFNQIQINLFLRDHVNPRICPALTFGKLITKDKLSRTFIYRAIKIIKIKNI